MSVDAAWHHPVPPIPVPCLPAACLQANAVPTIFWVLGLLLLPENQQHLEAVVAEARQATGLSSLPGQPANGSTNAGAVAGMLTAAAKAPSRTRGSGEAAAAQDSPQHAKQAQHAQQAGQLLSEEQQQGLVELACNRHSQIAAAISETLRLRCFRWGTCCMPAYICCSLHICVRLAVQA